VADADVDAAEMALRDDVIGLYEALPSAEAAEDGGAQSPAPPPAPFSTQLAEFLSTEDGQLFAPTVRLAADGTLEASLLLATLMLPYDTETNYAISIDIRQIVGESGLDAVVSSIMLEPSYTLYHLKHLVVRNVCIAAAVCCCLLLLLVEQSAPAILGTVALLFVSVDMLGMLALLGIPVSAITFVQLILATGLSVDAIGHAAHALGHAEQRRAEIHDACRLAMGPVGQSIASSLIAFLPAWFSTAGFFRTCARILSSVWVLSMLHALVFLPAAAFLAAELRSPGGIPRASEGGKAGGNKQAGMGRVGSETSLSDIQQRL